MSTFSRTPGTALTVALPEPNLATIPEQLSHQGMSVAQFSAILLAYWKHIATLTLLAAFLGAVAIKLLPHTYTATATLIVSSDVKDPLAGRDFPAEMINNYVATQIELMSSPIVLLPVIQRLNLTQDKEFGGGGNGNRDAVQEAVQKKLAAAIRVDTGTGGQLLYVSASARSANKAADIANAVAEVYLDQDRRRVDEPATERAQRYSEELAELREKASVAQKKVTTFGKENGIEDLSTNSTGVEVQALDTLHQRLLETQNLRRTLESKQYGLPTVDGANGTSTTLLLQKLCWIRSSRSLCS